MNPATSINQSSALISHSDNSSSLESHLEALKQKIISRGDLPHAPIKRQLELLIELASFPLGQFLIQNKGLNGFWTDYILRHPETGRITGANPDGVPFSELEDYILNRAPTVLATQERFSIFKQETQKRLKETGTYASIPCGLMSDLLSLDYSGMKKFNLFGVDIDENSVSLAASKVPSEFVRFVSFFQDDAWTFTLPQKADLITSNGLNIYEKDPHRIVALYRQFYNNIKPGGCLIISFLTPPPTLSPDSEWEISKIDQEDALLQKIIFADILGAAWQHYRTSQETTEYLKEAGFADIQIIKDKAGIFPTVIAKRSEI